MLRRFNRSVEYYGVRGAIVHSYQRFFRSLKNHGFAGTFERAFVKAPAPPQPQRPSAPQAPHYFDILHGTDTGGNYSAADFPSASLSALYATGYLGVPPSALRPALAALPIRHEDFTFIDIGCGKGRALFVAAEYPFRQLVGVEIAGELCEVARSNVELDPAWKERISIVNQDAAACVYPEGPLMLFFYYPFFTPVLRRVLANLERQLRRSPRETYLLHADFCVPEAGVDASTVRYQKVMKSFAFIRELSDATYMLSAEDAALEPVSCTAKRFTFYSARVTR
jgi:SAM-dependent methyltransferase